MVTMVTHNEITNTWTKSPYAFTLYLIHVWLYTVVLMKQ